MPWQPGVDALGQGQADSTFGWQGCFEANSKRANGIRSARQAW